MNCFNYLFGVYKKTFKKENRIHPTYCHCSQYYFYDKCNHSTDTI